MDVGAGQRTAAESAPLRPADFVEAGRLLFAGPCEFIWGAADINGLPPMAPPEIAFAGRSNVGKSSLVNALTGRTTLARVSHTPGRTQQLNFFALGGPPGAERIRLVDMPGYGYASVGKEKSNGWMRLMQAYLAGRASLMRVFVLIDGRHGPKPPDLETMTAFDRAAVSYQVALTKFDEVKPGARAGVVEATLAALARRPAAHPEILTTSSRTKEGVAEFRAVVARLLSERGA